MSEPNLPPAASTSKIWWFAWILATVIIPGSSLLLLSASAASQNVTVAIVSLGLVGVVALALHVISSFKLSNTRSSFMTALLIFGGWLLMAVSYFAGCLALAQ
jgi:hypothetical protein